LSDKEKVKPDMTPNPMMNMLVSSVLKKHGISKDQAKKISDEEKANILKMFEDLKAQSDAIIQQQQEKKEGSQSKASSQSEERPRRRRNRSNKNKLREKLRQRRQTQETDTNEEKNGDLE